MLSYFPLKCRFCRASLVGQYWRLHLPVQGTRVRSLVQEDPTCHGAAEPIHHNCWACALVPGAATTEPVCRNYWNPCVREPHAPQEKPPQWEASTLQLESSLLTIPREKPVQQLRPKDSQKSINFFLLFLMQIVWNYNLISQHWVRRSVSFSQFWTLAHSVVSDFLQPHGL